MSASIQRYTDAYTYHHTHLNRLRMLETIGPHMRDLFERISDAEHGLSLIECACSIDRTTINETRIRLEMMCLDGHITFIQNRFYNSSHIIIIPPIPHYEGVEQ